MDILHWAFTLKPKEAFIFLHKSEKKKWAEAFRNCKIKIIWFYAEQSMEHYEQERATKQWYTSFVIVLSVFLSSRDKF